MAQITPDTLPDYHFLMVAPNLEPEWFFRGARAYWERFRPTVIKDGALLTLLPSDVTVAVSILTRRDAFETLAVEVARNLPRAYIDALIYETVREAAGTLDARAAANQPFGVPLRPTAVPPTRVPITPTLGAVTGPIGTPTPTPNTSGFITQTPTASPAAPTEDDGPTDTPQPPIQPTPGAITGGS
jgi:hypothetical protein